MTPLSAYSRLSINDLQVKACRGDQAAEHALFESLAARFRAFARQRVWDNADSEEVVQDALMTICREYKALTFETSFTAWAYKVLDNRILAHIQKKKRRGEKVTRMIDGDQMLPADQGTPDPDLKRRLLSCLHKLGKANVRYARILNLHYQGFSTTEVCRRMSVKRETFYSILSRARAMLQNCLESGNLKS